MKRAYRFWSLEEKRSAVARMESVTHGVLAKELGIERRVLYNWRAYLRRLDKSTKLEASREKKLELEVRELKQALATKVLEADFLQGVLRRIETQRRPASSSGSGETASTSKCA
jgi:transposase-like protein